MMLGDAVSERLARRHTRNLREKAIEIVLLCAALVSVATTVGIVFILVKESLVFSGTFPSTIFSPIPNGHRFSMTRTTASWCSSPAL